jgi:hypothetical protein
MSSNYCKPLECPCFSSQNINILKKIIPKEDFDFASLIQSIDEVATIKFSRNELQKKLKSKIADNHFTPDALTGKVAVVLSIATGILFGCLFSSIAVGLSLGVISCIAGLYFTKVRNNYLLENHNDQLKQVTEKLKQDIDCQDKKLPPLMNITKEFCKNFSEVIFSRYDSVAKEHYNKHINSYSLFSSQQEAIISNNDFKRAFPDIKNICDYYNNQI